MCFIAHSSSSFRLLACHRILCLTFAAAVKRSLFPVALGLMLAAILRVHPAASPELVRSLSRPSEQVSPHKNEVQPPPMFSNIQRFVVFVGCDPRHMGLGSYAAHPLCAA